ncbi:MAG: hypothetical protein WD407_00345, partial [Rhodospirillales bacterium]
MTILQSDSILKPYRFLLKIGLIKTRLIKTGWALSLALIGVCMSAAAFDVRAQQTPYYNLNTPEVTVDLSVLNDGGLGAPRVGAVSPSVGGGNLLMPGRQPPTSRLLVKPPRKPSAARSTVERKPRKARAETKTAKAAPKAAP